MSDAIRKLLTRRSRRTYFGAALITLFAVPAMADDRPIGSYLCTVDQKAGIAQEHMEGSDPPAAFIDKRVTRFRIRISPVSKSAAGGAKFKVEELPYAGPLRDRQMWQTSNSVLHRIFAGDGWRFNSLTDQAFLRFDVANPETGWLFFHHAGFENRDDYNVNLSIRAGTCEPVK